MQLLGAALALKHYTPSQGWVIQCCTSVENQWTNVQSLYKFCVLSWHTSLYIHMYVYELCTKRIATVSLFYGCIFTFGNRSALDKEFDRLWEKPESESVSWERKRDREWERVRVRVSVREREREREKVSERERVSEWVHEEEGKRENEWNLINKFSSYLFR